METMLMTLDLTNRIAHINKDIYGHFAEHLGYGIYGGVFVGADSPIPNIDGFRTDVLETLRAIHVPVIRWPGGCFADTYHWRDGIGPKEKRRGMVNTNWGGVTEPNSFGTHEFLDFCELLGCEAYVCLNIGSATVQEAVEWVEYMTSSLHSPITDLRKANGRAEPWNVKYIGVGNESWGCGGNMDPEYYSNLYRQFRTFMPGLSKYIACGPNGGDLNWTATLMDRIPSSMMDGLSLHYYTIPSGDFSHKGPSINFSAKEYFLTLVEAYKLKGILEKQTAVLRQHRDEPSKASLVVDEWGVWADVIEGTHPSFLHQQNSMRDAIVAARTLDLFNQSCEFIEMANIAQMVNVLQAILLTKDKELVKTPTYYVYDLYQGHMDSTLLYSHCNSPLLSLDSRRIPMISQSASIDLNGKIHITISNASLDTPVRVDCAAPRLNCEKAKGRILESKFNAVNTFSEPTEVVPKEFNDIIIQNDQITFELPPCSILSIELS